MITSSRAKHQTHHKEWLASFCVDKVTKISLSSFRFIDISFTFLARLPAYMPTGVNKDCKTLCPHVMSERWQAGMGSAV